MTQITITGNLTGAPELRWTQGGKAVVNCTVAVNRKKGEESDFYRVTVWEDMAQNVAQLEKGTRVVVVGRLESRQYETREGQKQTAWEITADAFGPDMRWAVATVTKSQRRDEQPVGSWSVPSEAGDADSTPF